MSAHTPGPLKVVRGEHWWQREVWTDGPAYTRPICELSQSEAERDEIEANALLFAAASDLLEVARHCEDLLWRYEINRVDGDEISEAALLKIRAAIAKATQA